MKPFSFKAKSITKNLLADLTDRNRDILVRRFGLGTEPRKQTLESIGQKYGITRERVRQIENFALGSIKKSPVYENERAVFDELQERLSGGGAIVSEHDFLNAVSNDKNLQNHIHFLLVLGDPFERKQEDQHFRHRWSVNEDVSRLVHQALHTLYQGLADDDLVEEDALLSQFETYLRGVPEEYHADRDVLRRWLSLSKMIGKNLLGEWGLASSPNINARGVRDYAYLVIRHHGEPLHFTDVAKKITETFGRSAHTATCHNELIKDKARFVLVGRGLYGLAEWGYANGVVRDVIRRILETDGPLSKEELVQRVLAERQVKENTIAVNLQNRTHFRRMGDGKYIVV